MAKQPIKDLKIQVASLEIQFKSLRKRLREDFESNYLPGDYYILAQLHKIPGILQKNGDNNNNTDTIRQVWDESIRLCNYNLGAQKNAELLGVGLKMTVGTLILIAILAFIALTMFTFTTGGAGLSVFVLLNWKTILTVVGAIGGAPLAIALVATFVRAPLLAFWGAVRQWQARRQIDKICEMAQNWEEEGGGLPPLATNAKPARRTAPQQLSGRAPFPFFFNNNSSPQRSSTASTVVATCSP